MLNDSIAGNPRQVAHSPKDADIQLDMIYDYRTNLALYPAIQAYSREPRPPTLIVWGQE